MKYPSTKQFQAVATGVIIGVAFIFPQLWWTAAVGLVVFFYLARSANTGTCAWWFGCLVGVVKMLLVLSWWWDAYPFDWMGFENHSFQAGVLGMYWSLTAVVIGVSMGMCAVLVRTLWPLGSYAQLVLIPFVLVVSEVMGSFAFSIFSLGTESVPNSAFSFGYVGYSVANHGILSIFAHVGGVYLLTFVLGVIAVFGLYAIGYTKSFSTQSRVSIAIGVLVVYIVSGQFSFPANHDPLGVTVATVHLNTPGYSLMAKQDFRELQYELRESYTDVITRGVDYVVIPEVGELRQLFDSPTEHLTFLQTKTDKYPVVIDSVNAVEGYVRTEIYDTKTETVLEVDKAYLVPHGEFFPYIGKVILPELISPDSIEKITQINSFRRGTNEQYALPNRIPGILFCFDSVDPLSAWRVSHEREVPFIAHQVSHGWFQRPSITLRYQLDQMLKVHARFAGVPIIQATNRGLPLSYLPNGTYVDTTPVYTGKYVQVYLVQI